MSRYVSYLFSQSMADPVLPPGVAEGMHDYANFAKPIHLQRLERALSLDHFLNHVEETLKEPTARYYGSVLIRTLSDEHAHMMKSFNMYAFVD